MTSRDLLASRFLSPRLIVHIAPLVCALVLAGCAHSRHIHHHVETAEKPWTSLELNNDPDKFHFAIVSDRTGGARPGIFETAVEKVNLMQPEFVMSVGDLIEGHKEDMVQVEKEWAEFRDIIAKFEMPFFLVPGNHDMKSNAM
ncbi:MAG TPA: metallophosphoesterase, partial [Candidatus Hydrogenedentes bacterium]|nr:metallophosphoesterase [Candidatus Hydrogenedentota bacterium]